MCQNLGTYNILILAYKVTAAILDGITKDYVLLQIVFLHKHILLFLAAVTWWCKTSITVTIVTMKSCQMLIVLFMLGPVADGEL